MDRNPVTTRQPGLGSPALSATVQKSYLGPGREVGLEDGFEGCAQPGCIVGSEAHTLAELPQANPSSTRPSPDNFAQTTAHSSAKPLHTSHERDTCRRRAGHSKQTKHTCPDAQRQLRGLRGWMPSSCRS